MKTQQTKDMEQALIRDALRKGKHPALEVPLELWVGMAKTHLELLNDAKSNTEFQIMIGSL